MDERDGAFTFSGKRGYMVVEYGEVLGGGFGNFLSS
jgi:hypothetical protein